MKLNQEFIKEQFKEIEMMYFLKWTRSDEHLMTLENESIYIDIASERWDEGVIINFFDKKSKQFYTLDVIESSKGVSNSFDYLSGKEKSFFDEIDKMDDKIIYAFKILLEKYCKKELGGDFSELETSEKDEN